MSEIAATRDKSLAISLLPPPLRLIRDTRDSRAAITQRRGRRRECASYFVSLSFYFFIFSFSPFFFFSGSARFSLSTAINRSSWYFYLRLFVQTPSCHIYIYIIYIYTYTHNSSLSSPSIYNRTSPSSLIERSPPFVSRRLRRSLLGKVRASNFRRRANAVYIIGPCNRYFSRRESEKDRSIPHQPKLR